MRRAYANKERKSTFEAIAEEVEVDGGGGAGDVVVGEAAAAAAAVVASLHTYIVYTRVSIEKSYDTHIIGLNLVKWLLYEIVQELF